MMSTTGHTATGLLQLHPYISQSSEACRSVPKHIYRAIRSHHRPRALAVEHVAPNQFRAAEGLPAVTGHRHGDRRLYEVSIRGIENKSRPRHVDVVAKRARGVGIRRKPWFVV